VLAAFETLLPLFDGDERRTILYLQHVMGTVLTRPYEVVFKTISERKEPLDKIDKMCCAEASLLSLGDDHCRFAVQETDDPLAGYTDKVEQRFADKLETG